MQKNSLYTYDDYVNFLSANQDYSHLGDDISLWWIESHECYLNDRNIHVHSTRILFGPKRKPNLNKYILWTDSVYLTDLLCFIHIPFNFDSHSEIISAT